MPRAGRLRQRVLRVAAAADRKRVARLMQCEGIQGVARRKQFRTTMADPAAERAPDLTYVISATLELARKTARHPPVAAVRREHALNLQVPLRVLKYLRFNDASARALAPLSLRNSTLSRRITN